MNHHHIARAPLGVVGTLLFVGALAAPASARPDPGTTDVGSTSSELAYSQHAYENHYTSPLPAPKVSVPEPAVIIRFRDNGGLELMQVGAGLLAGIALTGAGLAAASRRGHGHVAHPA